MRRTRILPYCARFILTLTLTGVPSLSWAGSSTDAIIQLEADAIAQQARVWAAGAAVDQAYREIVIQQSLQPAKPLTAAQITQATKTPPSAPGFWQLLQKKSKSKTPSPLAVAQQTYQAAIQSLQAADEALAPLDAQLDAQLAARLDDVLQDPALAGGNLVPLLEQSCFRLGIATRRALPFGLRTVIAGLTDQYTGDVVAEQTLTKYCLNAVHGEFKPATAHLSDWILGSLYLNTAQALALDAALAKALQTAVQEVDALPITEAQRALVRHHLLSVGLNPVLNLFDVIKRVGTESQLWLAMQSLLPSIDLAAQNPFLEKFGLYLYDPAEGLMKQQFFCAGADAQKAGLGGIPGMAGIPGKSGGMGMKAGGPGQGAGMGPKMAAFGGGGGMGKTPFGASMGKVKEKNCQPGGGSPSGAFVGAALQGECMGFDSFMNVLLDPASHGMGTCSLWSTAAAGKGCNDTCGGGSDGGGTAGACGVQLPQLGWVMCHRDPFSNPIAPNPQPYRSGGEGGGGRGPGGAGMGGGELMESIVKVPVGSLCGAASGDNPEKTETPIKTPLDEKIDKNKKQAGDGFGPVADGLRNQANANSHNITPEQHAAALAHAQKAMANATPVNFEKVTPGELAKKAKEEGATPLVGGSAVLSPDGGTVSHASGKPGQPQPGGLYDPASGRIFLNKGVAASGQGTGVVQHEGGHAYLSGAGVASKEHHGVMAESGTVPMQHGGHLCQGDTCSNQCTSVSGQFAPPGGCQGYPQGPDKPQPDCIVAECQPPGTGSLVAGGMADATDKNSMSGGAASQGNLSSCAPSTSNKSACWAVDCGPAMGARSPLADSDVKTSKGGGTGTGSGTAQCCNKGGGDPRLGLDWSNLPGFGLWDPSPMMQSFIEHAATPTDTLPQQAQPMPATPQP
ncbi:MAG: hypothetical protein HY696_11050 [Deltaproteobacteria bacterium]|nr:hypothetical protein [Deltaproteobacteria bacterium]